MLISYSPWCFSLAADLIILSILSDSTPSQLAPKRTRPVNLETQAIKQELTALLKHLKRSAAEDFVKFVQALINKLYQCVDTPVEDVSELVQDFYHDLTERMAIHPLYKGNRLNYVMKTHPCNIQRFFRL